jgi:hypothetical protein
MFLCWHRLTGYGTWLPTKNNAGSNPAARTNFFERMSRLERLPVCPAQNKTDTLLLSSRGQDDALPTRKRGFDSRQSHQFFARVAKQDKASRYEREDLEVRVLPRAPFRGMTQTAREMPAKHFLIGSTPIFPSIFRAVGRNGATPALHADTGGFDPLTVHQLRVRDKKCDLGKSPALRAPLRMA